MALAGSHAAGQRFDDADSQAVYEALADKEYDFRTVDGIAATSGLSPDRIQEILDEHPDLFRLSAVPGRNGEGLYTLSSRPVTGREQLAMARSVVAKTVA